MTTQIKKDALVPYRDALATVSPHLEMALPATARKFLTPERLSKLMLSAIGRNPTLAACSVRSILNVVMTAASLGLEPASPLGHLYAVPFKNNKTGEMEAIPIVGYRGYLELARRSEKIKSVEAHVVHENDKFEIAFGREPKLTHSPCLRGGPGDVLAAYVVAEFDNGARQVEFMTGAQIDAVRKRSCASNNGPWVTDYEEMARKTVVRRAAKYWPLSTEMAHAIGVEDSAEAGELDIDAAGLGLPQIDGAVEDSARAQSAEPQRGRLASRVKANGKKQDHDPTTGEVHDYGPPPLSDDEAAAMGGGE